MKELSEIVAARRLAPGVPHVLATVLRVEGSSYRRPGARMLMNVHGRVAGSISGGCLEKSVIAAGRRSLVEDSPRLLAFDTTEQGDSSFGVSLGCQGKIWISLEIVPAQAPWVLESVVSQVSRRRKPAVLISRILDKGSGRLETSFVFEDESESCGMAVRGVFARRKTQFFQDEICGDALIEWLAPPMSLLLFGAGPDAVPMLRLARELGHEVTMIDRRAEFARRESFPGARAVLLAQPHELASRLSFDDRTVAVLMNHHYDTDREVLAALIPVGLPYLALLGPKKRTQRILKDLQIEGHDVNAVAKTLHGPAGLDIGAESPEQIALAILAEIQAAFANRDGGKLRLRTTPIYTDASTLLEPSCVLQR